MTDILQERSAAIAAREKWIRDTVAKAKPLDEWQTARVVALLGVVTNPRSAGADGRT